ncbi:MAG: hypothetical protein QMC85_02040 [Methanocellales archaeon]|nr:hypothetical protein [Methanocellales archaeon]
MVRLESRLNKIAHEIYDAHKHEIEERGGDIVVIDIDQREIVDVIDECETLSLIQRMSKKHPSHQIYLLKTDLNKPVVWTR